jgi:hypothetical protein
MDEIVARLRGEVGVAHCGLDIPVAQVGFDCCQWNTLHNELTGEGMPEIVDTNLGYAGGPAQATERDLG